MKCEPSLIHRIKRAQGQLQGIANMMENDNACMDIVTQLKAVRATIDKTIGLLTTNNLIQTIEQNNDIKLENINEALELVVKSIK